MRRKNRIPKSLAVKLTSLDDCLYLLRLHLSGLKEDLAHLRDLSAGLRVLICYSGRTEGLLWRLATELDVSDEIYLHVTPEVNRNSPWSRDLAFMLVPIQRGGLGDPRIPPQYHSLKHVIKNHEAVFIVAHSLEQKLLTHEYLIKAISQQMGSAHEDEGVEFALDKLEKIKLFTNGVATYVPLIVIDAGLTLQIGERVLGKAEKECGYLRKHRSSEYGNISIVFKLRLHEHLAARIPVASFKSYISEIDVDIEVGPKSAVFKIGKCGTQVQEITGLYPEEGILRKAVVFVVQFSSRSQQVSCLVTMDGSVKSSVQIDDCNLGWLHAQDMTFQSTLKDRLDLVENSFISCYERLLSSEECAEMSTLQFMSPPGIYE